VEDVRAALDAAPKWLRATPDEVRAVRRYQSLDGEPEHLNAMLASGDAGWRNGPLRQVVRGLDTLLARAYLPVDLVTYRGVADVDAHVPAAAAVTRRPAYLSTSLDRGVAERDFAIGTRPGLLRVAVRRGAHGLWVPPLGRRDLAYEQEVLLPRDTTLRYGGRTMEGKIVVVECEVIP
jgi:hypothetical protein